MMSFIEYQKVDLLDRDECMHQAVIQDFGRAHNCHVLTEMFIPRSFVPEIRAHVAAKAVNLVIEIAFEDSKLLKD